MRRLSLLSVLVLSACSLAPDYLRPDVSFTDNWDWLPGNRAPEPIGPDAALAAPKAAVIPTRWWEGFNSPALNALVTQALSQNTDLAASVARVKQARANLRIERASLFPQVDANAGRTHQLYNGQTSKRHTTSAGVSASYELDLFGANQSRIDSSRFTLAADQYNRDALALVVASDVTTAYLSLVTTIEQQRLAEQNLKSSKEVLAIVQAQYDAGRRSALELAQQRTAVATTQATIASLIREQEINRHQLAVLTGAAPQGYAAKVDKYSAITIPNITPTLPSAMLEQRPDVRAAESELQAANADIGAARAAFFPTASIGLGDAWVKSAGSVITLSAQALAPIFSAGSLEGGLELSKARKEELVANYRGVVLAAFQEASDALTNVKSADARAKLLNEAAAQSREAYSLARLRYEQGAIDYQTLLDTQRTLLSNEDAAVGAYLDRLQAAVDLCKALGGAPDKTQ